MSTDVSDFISTALTEPPVARLSLSGELDAFTAHGVSRQAIEAVADGCTDICVDLADVTFIDAAGIGLLIRLQSNAATVGGRLEIAAASESVHRLCAMLDLTDALGLPPEPCPREHQTGAVPTLPRPRPWWRRRGVA